ncbi:hypothetical protein ACFE04_015486 [Oxalis oulophora]
MEHLNDIPFKMKKILKKIVERPTPEELGLDATKNWRDEGCVVPHQKQGRCNCCWATSTTSTISSARFINKKDKKLTVYSHQQLIDCSKVPIVAIYDSVGCYLSHYKRGFEWVYRNGLSTADDYPYKRTKGPCKKEVDKIKPIIDTYAEIHDDDYEELIRRIAIQPVAMSIDIHPEFIGIKGKEVYSGPPDGLESQHYGKHAVVTFGYGTDEITEKKYFDISNTWGKVWGEGGDARIDASVTIFDWKKKCFRPLLHSAFYPCFYS